MNDNTTNKIDILKEELKLHGNDTPHISRCVAGVSTLSRLIDIIDGDTIVCVIPMLGQYFKFNVRLDGIDACEMKSKDPSLREKALKARDYLVKRLLNQSQRMERKEIQKHLETIVVVVYLHCRDFDKYGRLLADVYVDNTLPKMSLSEELIQEVLAYPYNGGKKKM